MSSPLNARAAELPTSPGVYLFKSARGRVLYVGKANNLRARVRQYLSGQDGRIMVPFLVRDAHSIDVVLTTTEKEALLLENTLIKKHRPRFNVRLRDDSSFLHLRLDLSERWPRYRLVRRIKADGARYFGPFASAQKARQTLTYLQRAYPLRTCTDHVLRTRKRPCILHGMGRCAAPCVGLVDAPTYQQLAEQSTAMLDGRSQEAIRGLTTRMQQSAENEAFEEAARLRDMIRSIQQTVERQHVIDTRLGDRDVWGLHRDGFTVGLSVLPVREGAMGEPLSRVARGVVGDDAELLSSVLNTHYVAGTTIPAEILIPTLPEDADALEAVLTERRGRRVHLRRPERGDKARLVELAAKNAALALQHQTSLAARTADALSRVAALAGLREAPHRIECFDNSHLGGANPVAAMAVFLDGRPAKDAYRRYRIKTATDGDDYGAMREILGRRFVRGLREGELPDLVLIDGGRGQVAAAVAAAKDAGCPEVRIIGISKPRTEHARGQRHATDKIVVPEHKDPLRLPAHDPGLRLLQHLRDETHNHAVRYQRKVRSKDAFRTALEEVPGIGPERRRALLKHLGSLEAVLDADEATLAAVPGIGAAVAKAIREAVGGEGA